MHSVLALSSIILASTVFNVGGTARTPMLGGVKTYTVQLTGEAEVSSSASNRGGDMDGAGLARLSIDPAGKKICYDFTLRGLETPLMAHIHRADAKHIGPTVVTLFTGPAGDLTNCVRWTEVRLAEIVSTPSNFYVNVYTTEYPDGALRGQLMG